MVVDVVTALAMLAATLALTLTALTTALQVEHRAAERRAARVLLQDLADRDHPLAGEDGVSGPFHWRVRLEPLASTIDLSNCSLEVTAASGGRDYALSTIRPCPPPPAEQTTP